MSGGVQRAIVVVAAIALAAILYPSQGAVLAIWFAGWGLNSLIAQRDGAHVLSAALLCFPASWTLAEKIGRPLGAIHGPVPDYDAGIAARVDRLFSGVREGRPLWRANLLRYEDPALHQPRTEADPRRTGTAESPYLRSERQTILRLAPDLVLFAIHTSVVRA